MMGIDAPTNAASERARQVHEWCRADNWERVSESMTAGARILGAAVESGANAGSQPLDADSARRVGFGSEESHVLAIRDEHLALMNWVGSPKAPNPDRRFAVVELDQRGQISSVRLFDWAVDSLTEAADYLDERWMETTRRDDVDVLVSDAIRGWRHGDQATLERILHEEFRAVDHRTFGWGEFDKATFIGLFDGNQRNVVVEIAGEYLGGTPSARAFQLAAWGCADGGLIEALVGHFVSIVSDGQVLHAAGYDLRTPEEMLSQMRTLVEELELQGPGSGSGDGDTRV
jgi:hypothetical protein